MRDHNRILRLIRVSQISKGKIKIEVDQLALRKEVYQKKAIRGRKGTIKMIKKLTKGIS